MHYAREVLHPIPESLLEDSDVENNVTDKESDVELIVTDETELSVAAFLFRVLISITNPFSSLYSSGLIQYSATCFLNSCCDIRLIF